MPDLELDEPDEADASLAEEVFRAWQTGSQEQAIEMLRPLVEKDRPWALAFISWLYLQRGIPAMTEGIPYAKRAADMGMPWAALNIFNNLTANAASFPHVLEPALDLVSHSGPLWSGIDTVSHGWSLIDQGRAADAVRLMSLRTPFPVTTREWATLGKSARDQIKQINESLKRANAAETQVSTAAAEHIQAMEKARSDLETSANQADLLVTKVTSVATEARFQEDANRNEEESKSAWTWGLWVLAFAAIVAILPLGLHYLGVGPDYSTGTLLGAHAASTVALATVAGVLLARARSRDLARQRANDLSTAIATMITYSSQISDERERQTFMTTMGQLVLQSHLTTGSNGHQTEESLPGLIALLNLLKAGSPSTSS